MAERVKIRMLRGNEVKSIDKRYADVLVRLKKAVYVDENKGKYSTKVMTPESTKPVVAESVKSEFVETNVSSVVEENEVSDQDIEDLNKSILTGTSSYNPDAVYINDSSGDVSNDVDSSGVTLELTEQRIVEDEPKKRRGRKKKKSEDNE